MTADLVRHTRILETVGDMIRVRSEGAALSVTLQIFTGRRGLATNTAVRLPGHPFEFPLRRFRFGAAKES